MIFTTLNFERTNIVLNHLFTEANGQPLSMIAVKSEKEEIEKVSNSKINLEIIDPLEIKNKSSKDITLINNLIKKSNKNNVLEKNSSIRKETENVNENDRIAAKKEFQKVGSRSLIQSLTPVQVAIREPILLPTRYLCSFVFCRNIKEIREVCQHSFVRILYFTIIIIIFIIIIYYYYYYHCYYYYYYYYYYHCYYY